ncbi:hypothetical protein KIH86_11800 [Paenibacillus sp. HN-1]|uniref:hypothetical protein n=1 Tax=Paenibacillus TaxID=44249 RepID=UPI001CA864FF|nr:MULTISPECIES: hypothetical protein [Paenibacillus]MBY9081385.1 hypothetical protein [Paenibacillus sp. CGMCC 1.18879]MBY9084905.1 hypothetical protein [Paenibacillus sinensis]
MSDFMKEIVQEALRGGAGRRQDSNRGGAGRRQDLIRGNEPSRQNPGARSTSAVPGISRPNYQRDRKEQRLGAVTGSVTGLAAGSVSDAALEAGLGMVTGSASGGNGRAAAVLTAASVPASAGSPAAAFVPAHASSLPAFASHLADAPVAAKVPAVPASAAASAALLTRDFIEESLAPLMRMSLVQGNSREECSAVCADTAAAPDESGMLGRSCAGMDFWYYPELQPELFGELGIRRSSAKSAGIITEDRCRPGQLFLLDGCSVASGVDVEINWKLDGERAFQAVLTGEASSDIRSALQCMYDQCERNASRRIQSYIALEPSPILIKHLNISRGDAVAALEGISRYRSVALLDRALKLGMSPRVKISIADEYVILTGERGVLSEASALLGKLIEPYA